MKNKETEKEKVILAGFIVVPVFSVENTDGEPLEVPELTPKELPPLFEVAQKWDIKIEWQSFQGEAYGYFSPGRKEIVLATQDENVFFHELAHAAHQRVKGKLNGKQDWKEEIVAELTASVLAHMYGKRTNDGASYQYIRSYAEKAGRDVQKACLRVISDVGRCVERVIQTKEETSHALPCLAATAH